MSNWKVETFAFVGEDSENILMLFFLAAVSNNSNVDSNGRTKSFEKYF